MQFGNLLLPFGDGFGLYKLCGSREVACNTQPGSWITGFQYFFQQRVVAEWRFNKYLGLIVSFSQVFQFFYTLAAFGLINRQIAVKGKALPVKA